MDHTDYYTVLNISRTASKNEICNAYKTLSIMNHPELKENLNKRDVENQFNIICEAFEVLYDNKKRAIYDVHGYDSLHNGINDEFGGYCYMGNSKQIFEDFFGTENVYTAILHTEKDIIPFFCSNKKLETNPPSDLIIEVELSLKEIIHGCSKVISFERNILTNDFLSIKKETVSKEIYLEKSLNPYNSLKFLKEGNEKPGHEACNIKYIYLNS